MLHHLQIRTKILSGFGVMVLLATGIGLMGWVALVRVNSATRNANMAGEIISQAKDAELIQNKYIENPDPALYKDAEAKVQAMHSNIAELSKHVVEEDKQTLQTIDLQVAQWLQQMEGVIANEDTKNAKELEMITQANQATALIEEMLRIQQENVKKEITFAAEIRTETQKNVDNANQLIFLGADTELKMIRYMENSDADLKAKIDANIEKMLQMCKAFQQGDAGPSEMMRISSLNTAARYYKTSVDQWEKVRAGDDADAKAAARKSLSSRASRFTRAAKKIVGMQEDALQTVVEGGTQDIENKMAEIEQVRELLDLIKDIRAKEAQYIRTKDSKLLEEHEAMLVTLEEKRLKYRGSIYDQADFQRVADIKNAVGLYKISFHGGTRTTTPEEELKRVDDQYMFAITYEGGYRSAGVSQAEQIKQMRESSANMITQIQVLNENEKKHAFQAGVEALLMIVGLTVMAAIVGVAFALFLSFMITRPIREMVHVVNDIAEGEGDLTRQIPVKGKDEMSQLGTGMNKFINKIHDLIVEVRYATEDVAKSANEIASGAEEMSDAILRQEAQTNMVSAAIEEMASSVILVAQQSTEAANAAENAGKRATDGGDVVRETVEGMNEITRVVSRSAEKITELGQRSDEIGLIVNVINDIADQTNLLALNAAIEAARAGEHGRGFAVVADEVRKLASRTTKATDEVTSAVRMIQDGTHLAVNDMNKGSEVVQKGAELANEARHSLETIVYGSQEVLEMIQSIAASSDEQSSAAAQIAENVEQISQIGQQTSINVQNAAMAAVELNDKSDMLLSMVNQFKLNEDALRPSDSAIMDSDTGDDDLEKRIQEEMAKSQNDSDMTASSSTVSSSPTTNGYQYNGENKHHNDSKHLPHAVAPEFDDIPSTATDPVNHDHETLEPAWTNSDRPKL